MAIRSSLEFNPTFGYFDICIHFDSNVNNFSNILFLTSDCGTTGIGMETFTGTIQFQIPEIELFKEIWSISKYKVDNKSLRHYLFFYFFL